MGKGDRGGEGIGRGGWFEAASEHLETLDGEAALAGDDAGREKDEKSAAPKDISPREAELLAVKNKTVGLLGFVSKVARLTTAGRVSGIIVIVNQRVTKRIRLKRGEAELRVLTPKAQADVEQLSAVLADSYGPLDETTDHLIGEILTWHNKQPAAVDDPSRFSFELDVASMVRDARGIKSSLKAVTDAYGKLGPAHQDIVTLLTAKPEDWGASEKLLKSGFHATKV